MALSSLQFLWYHNYYVIINQGLYFIKHFDNQSQRFQYYTMIVLKFNDRLDFLISSTWIFFCVFIQGLLTFKYIGIPIQLSICIVMRTMSGTIKFLFFFICKKHWASFVLLNTTNKSNLICSKDTDNFV